MTANSGQGSTFNQRFIRRIKPAILTCAMTATALFSAVSAVSAQPATCDPKYWDSLKAKAWTEAEREIEQNQNYIYKADSVLQYTCFKQFLGVLAAQAPNMFSQTGRWGPITGVNMNTALQNLVTTSVDTYIQNNFSNNYLGEFSSITPANVGGATYNCDEMRKVWQAAKCQDFANASPANGKANTSANTDFFYMSTYNGNDYRKYPANLACDPAQAWAATYATSINSDDHYPKEVYDAYDKFFIPTACGDPGIIPTGVQVRRIGGGGAAYPEIICVKAGCASNATGTACEAAP